MNQAGLISEILDQLIPSLGSGTDFSFRIRTNIQKELTILVFWFATNFQN
jgi:hypothetical protein